MDAKWRRQGDQILITGQFTQESNGVYTVMSIGQENKNVVEMFEYKVGDILKHKFGAEYEVVAVDSYRNFSNEKIKPHSFKLKNLSNGCTDTPKWIPRDQVYEHYTPASGMAKILYGKR